LWLAPSQEQLVHLEVERAGLVAAADARAGAQRDAEAPAAFAALK
jgi:hypothetical protein